MSDEGVMLEFPPPETYGKRTDVTVLIFVPRNRAPRVWNWWHSEESYGRACARLRSGFGRLVSREELGEGLYNTVIRAAQMLKEEQDV